MDDVRTREPEPFPQYGARARTWRRFERDLAGWLETPAGRFAVWRARETLDPVPGADVESRIRTR
jgi:hypothetical protein